VTNTDSRILVFDDVHVGQCRDLQFGLERHATGWRAFTADHRPADNIMPKVYSIPRMNGFRRVYRLQRSPPAAIVSGLVPSEPINKAG
jgi:hypothetical protein